MILLAIGTDLLTQFDQVTANIGNAMTFLGLGLVVSALVIIIYIIMKARGSD